MPKLSVPFAIDAEGQLYSPASANKGENYFCPACREPLIFRKCTKKTDHFAHKVSHICNQETITHKIAKFLIQKTVQDWKLGKTYHPAVLRDCQICRSSICVPLPEKVDSAVLEYRLSDGSIVDVALIVGGMAQAAIEIKITHAVDEEKARRISIPFVELDGYRVIENPFVWKPITDNFNPFTCNKCKINYSKFKEKANHTAKKNKLELPAAYYRYGICKCWKCKNEIIVFAWPKVGMNSSSDPQVIPRPKTVQFRFSKTAGHYYWVNTCPYCKSIQGDFFLYFEPDGPFFGINNMEDSPAAFEFDMMRIAEKLYSLDK